MGIFARLAAYVSPAPAKPDAIEMGSPAAQKRRKRTSPPTVAKTRWYLADHEHAIRVADSGDLSAAARLYRSCRRDGVIHGLLSTRTGGLVRMRRKFSGDAEVTGALEGLRGNRTLFDELFPSAELALLAADGIFLGVGVAELVPQVSGRPELRRLEPEFLRYRIDEDRWYYNSYHEGYIPITPGDGRWVLHCPGGKQEPWTHGLWASLGRAYIAKEHALLHRENYSAKLANPARVAVAPQGATEGQKQSWFQKVMAWGVNTVFGMTPGYDVKLLESNGRGYEVFSQTIETSNNEFMIGLVGQIVTVTGGSGFSSNDLYATVRADLIEETGDALAFTINTQALPPWIGQAFGAGRTAAVAYDTTPAKNLKAEAESLSAAGAAIDDLSAALKKHGLRLDAATVAAKFSVPVLGDTSGDGEPDASGAVVPEEPLDNAAAASLAQQMTALAVPQCEHGRSNRCWLCGVERERSVTRGPDGKPMWTVAWRPIGGTPPALQVAA